MIRLPFLLANFKVQMREYLRDPAAAGFSFAMPFLFLVIFGLSSLAADARVTNVAVVTSEQAAEASERVLAALDTEAGIRPIEMDVEAARQSLFDKETEALIEVGEPTKIVVRAEDARFASFLSQRLELGVYRQVAGLESVGKPIIETLDGSTRNMFEFIAPGIFALALLQLGLLGTGNQILLARSRGVLRRLKSTPLSGNEIIGAHLLVRLVVAILQIVSLAIAMMLFFEIEFRQNFAYVLIASTTAAITFSTLGYMLGGFAPTQQAGSMIIMLVNFFLMFCGQIFFDVRGSGSVEILSYLNPVSYAADSFRFAVTGETAPLSFLMNQLIVIGWGAVFIFISLRYFNYHMESK